MSGNVAFIAAAIVTNYSSEYDGAMAHEGGSSSHTYTVELRFMGWQLEPADISGRLNLTASSELSVAESQNGARKRQPFWAYNGQGEVGFHSEWKSLDEGLRFLLGCLRSRKSEIAALALEFRAIWWCGHFQSSFGGGPTLPVELMTEIGSYGIPLSIDNYFSED